MDTVNYCNENQVEGQFKWPEENAKFNYVQWMYAGVCFALCSSALLLY